MLWTNPIDPEKIRLFLACHFKLRRIKKEFQMITGKDKGVFSIFMRREK